MGLPHRRLEDGSGSAAGFTVRIDRRHIWEIKMVNLLLTHQPLV
jgi:hypothetical protein